MKTRREGSSSGCVSSHADRAAATSRRSCSCQRLFLSVIWLAFRKRQIEPIAALTPRSSCSLACIACKVRSFCAATRASSQAAFSSLIRVLVAPPIGLAAAVPVSSQRRRQFTTVDTLTAKRRAAARQLAPEETAAITLVRKSREKAKAIGPGLLHHHEA